MTDQTISHAGLALIQNFEGCKLTAYRDSGGVWTIGYGHTSGAGAPMVHAGMQITQAEAEVILSNDLEKFEAIVVKHVTHPLTQHEFDALVSFTYNLGEPNFAKSTLLRMVNAGNMVGAKTQFARWTRAAGVVLQGLVRRRAAEAALFAAPDEPGARPQAPMKPQVEEHPVDALSTPSTPPAPNPSPQGGGGVVLTDTLLPPGGEGGDPFAPLKKLLDGIKQPLQQIADTVGPTLAPAGPLLGTSAPQDAADQPDTGLDTLMENLPILAEMVGGIAGKLGAAGTIASAAPHVITGIIADIRELPTAMAAFKALADDLRDSKKWGEVPNAAAVALAEVAKLVSNFGVDLGGLTTMVNKMAHPAVTAGATRAAPAPAA